MVNIPECSGTIRNKMTAYNNIAEIFLEFGNRVRSPGNNPFLLDDMESLYFVEEGEILIFSVDIINSDISGRRIPFCKVEKGEIFTGLSSRFADLKKGILAVGINQTELIKMPISIITKLLKDEKLPPSIKENISTHINNWICSVSRGISRDINPRTTKLAKQGQEYVLNYQESIRSQSGIVWISIEEGDAIFLEMEELSKDNYKHHFPLSQDTWIFAMSRLKIATKSTLDLINELSAEYFWACLRSFVEFITNCEIVNRRLIEVDEFNRIKDRNASLMKTKKNVLKYLSSIDGLKYYDLHLPEEDSPLFKACSIVCEYQKIELLPFRYLDRSRDPIGDLARNSSFRTRKVRLIDDWWKQDAGAFLGFLKENDKPVAIIPEKKSRYRLFNSNESNIIDEQIAKTISTEAYYFYTPFPKKALNGPDIISFCLKMIRKDILKMAIFGIICGILGLLVPFSLRLVIERVIPSSDLDMLLIFGISLFLAMVSSGLFEIAKNFALIRMEAKTDSVLQSAMTDRMLSLPVSFFSQYSSGDLNNRSMGIFILRQKLSGTTLISLFGVLFASFNIGLMLYIDSSLAIWICCTVLISILLNLLLNLLQIKHIRNVAETEGVISGMLFQYLCGISKLIVAGVQAHAFTQWLRKFLDQRKSVIKSRKLSNILMSYNESNIYLLLCMVFILFMLQKTNLISPGDFVAFNTAMIAFVTAMNLSAMTLTSLLQIKPVFERMGPIIKTLPEVTETKIDPGILSGKIEVTNVSYRYHPKNPLVLKKISIKVMPGEFIALAGMSGSGKTTIMRLLLGFDTPSSGTITYDGQDITAIDILALRRQMGVVLQNSSIVNGDILSNIIGSLPLTVNDAWQAAELAGVADDIREMPMEMNTVITAGSDTISGGQKQRIIIARALASSPRILFFDEATSAIDNKLQNRIMQSVEALQSTRIIIAHRLSTIKNADRIYVFQNGEIVQCGNYDELMSQKGLFLELASRQML